MACKAFELFDNFTEEELRTLSSFLSQYGLALSMGLTGMDKEEWLRYHKANMPEDILKEVKEAFELPVEELPKLVTVDEAKLEDLQYFERKKVSIEMALARDVAKFRLQEGS